MTTSEKMKWENKKISVDIVGKQELFQSVVGLSMTAGIFAAVEAIRGLIFLIYF